MPENKRTIEVCFSPALFNLFDAKDKIVVVIDILRATSSICIAFEHGVERILPVATVEESMTNKAKGFLVAAERNGETVEGFDFGNSPFSYMGAAVKGKTIALTTTNGTQAVKAARNAYKVVVGSFLNLDALCNWLKHSDKNVICLCAGWKNKYNLEDSLFAGAVVNQLKQSPSFVCNCDSALSSEHMYILAKDNLFDFLSDSSHRKRLLRLNIEKDVVFCLTPNQTKVIPVLEGEYLVRLNQ
jgi:2-phosphosulfolactate phosphatase